MIGNFSDDYGDLYVFFDEGEIEVLDDGSISGYLTDIDNPDLGSGSVEVVYNENLHGSRPLVGRESDGSIGDFQVVIEDRVYDRIVDGGVYSGSVSRYNSVPSRAELVLVPDEAEKHQSLLKELEALEKSSRK